MKPFFSTVVTIPAVLMISDTVLVAIVAAVPGVVSSVLSFFNRNKISQVKDVVNGRLTELLALTRAHYFAKGKKHAGLPVQEEGADDHRRRKELEQAYRFEDAP